MSDYDDDAPPLYPMGQPDESSSSSGTDDDGGSVVLDDSGDSNSGSSDGDKSIDLQSNRGNRNGEEIMQETLLMTDNNGEELTQETLLMTNETGEEFMQEELCRTVYDDDGESDEGSHDPLLRAAYYYNDNDENDDDESEERLNEERFMAMNEEDDENGGDDSEQVREAKKRKLEKASAEWKKAMEETEMRELLEYLVVVGNSHRHQNWRRNEYERMRTSSHTFVSRNLGSHEGESQGEKSKVSNVKHGDNSENSDIKDKESNEEEENDGESEINDARDKPSEGDGDDAMEEDGSIVEEGKREISDEHAAGKPKSIMMSTQDPRIYGRDKYHQLDYFTFWPCPPGAQWQQKAVASGENWETEHGDEINEIGFSSQRLSDYSYELFDQDGKPRKDMLHPNAQLAVQPSDAAQSMLLRCWHRAINAVSQVEAPSPEELMNYREPLGDTEDFQAGESGTPPSPACRNATDEADEPTGISTVFAAAPAPAAAAPTVAAARMVDTTIGASGDSDDSRPRKRSRHSSKKIVFNPQKSREESQPDDDERKMPAAGRKPSPTSETAKLTSKVQEHSRTVDLTGLGSSTDDSSDDSSPPLKKTRLGPTIDLSQVPSTDDDSSVASDSSVSSAEARSHSAAADANLPADSAGPAEVAQKSDEEAESPSVTRIKGGKPKDGSNSDSSSSNAGSSSDTSGSSTGSSSSSSSEPKILNNVRPPTTEPKAIQPGESSSRAPPSSSDPKIQSKDKLEDPHKSGTSSSDSSSSSSSDSSASSETSSSKSKALTKLTTAESSPNASPAPPGPKAPPTARSSPKAAHPARHGQGAPPGPKAPPTVPGPKLSLARNLHTHHVANGIPRLNSGPRRGPPRDEIAYSPDRARIECENLGIDLSDVSESDRNFCCPSCNIETNSLSHLESHYYGKPNSRGCAWRKILRCKQGLINETLQNEVRLYAKQLAHLVAMKSIETVKSLRGPKDEDSEPAYKEKLFRPSLDWQHVLGVLESAVESALPADVKNSHIVHDASTTLDARLAVTKRADSSRTLPPMLLNSAILEVTRNRVVERYADVPR